MFNKNNPLFQDPQVTYPIQDANLSFGDYANKCRQFIEKVRCDLTNNPLAPSIIDANTPFELKPEKATDVGAVLLHGLYDSPSEMRDIALTIQKQNILVRAHLLPGHGTVPGGLLNVTCEEWLKAAEYAITNLSKDVKKIFLVGFSTGATLLLYETLLKKYENIAGLILLAPAIQIYSALAFATRWPSLIDWIWTRAKWFNIAPEIDYAKYQSFTFNSAYQIYRLTKLLKKVSQNNKLSIPMLVAISEDDLTVFSKATLDYFKEYATANSELILYTNSDKKYDDKRIILRPATFSEWNIRNISHVAIPIAPSNSHYGMNGDYEFSSRVLENTNKNFYYSNQDHVDTQRLTFNPDFDFLSKAIADFVRRESPSV